MVSKLSELCEYSLKKIQVGQLNLTNYISTDNMLPNKGGIISANSLPAELMTQAYSKGNVLISNIRPYFKKIWLADRDGGCSNDVLVFVAKKGVDEAYLYYLLSCDDFFNYSMAMSKGTKMPRGDKIALMNYVVQSKNIDEQRRIAAILHSLDAKIKINKTINDNLAA